MKDLVYYNELFEIYGDLLTDNERNNFKDYYFEDLSLSEIAENKNVSRAAIQKTIKNVIDKLEYYERILKINQKNEILKESLKEKDINKIKDDINHVLEG